MPFAAVNEVLDAKKARKKRQAFYTPMALVQKLVEWAEVCPCCRCLEPSAGDGRIVHHLRKAGAGGVDACEIEAAMHDRIRAAGGEVVGEDFLAYRPAQGYDRIVMNPPFAGKASDRHIEHAWSLLKPGGRLLAVAPPTTGQRLERNQLALPGCEHAAFENIGPDWFKEFGTAIPVILVELLRRLPSEAGPVEGFSNLSTCNAALTVTTDATLFTQAAKLRPDQWLSVSHTQHFRREIGVTGGSVYGIDWAEVGEYVLEATRDRP